MTVNNILVNHFLILWIT